MKKVITLLFLCCSLLIYAQQQKGNTYIKYNGWTSHNVNGKVRKISTRSFKADESGRKIMPEQTDGYKMYYTFSRSGDEINYALHDAQNTLITTSTPFYKKGRIQYVIIKNEKEKVTECWTIRKYVNDYYGAEIDCYVKNIFTKRAVNEIDEKGHPTSLKLYDNEDKLILEQRFVYDEHGDLIKITSQMNQHQEIITTYRYTQYDTYHNWTQRLDQTGDKFLITERTIEYY